MDFIAEARKHLKVAIDEIQPTHIVSMVSGGRDSACSHALLKEFGIKPDLTIHGYTRCGIPETTNWVKEVYSNDNLVIADAGTAYEDYVLRKGFFGQGLDAHGFAYRILKATPFRKAISHELRQRKRNVKVLLVNGAFSAESANRKANLKRMRSDPAAPNNIWFNIIHDWTAEQRDAYLESRGVLINPVAKALCRSGECMCGTMQSALERAEAAHLYPHWGKWLNDLEKEVMALHGWGWGEKSPIPADPNQLDLFQPACAACLFTRKRQV